MGANYCEYCGEVEFTHSDDCPCTKDQKIKELCEKIIELIDEN